MRGGRREYGPRLGSEDFRRRKKRRKARKDRDWVTRQVRNKRATWTDFIYSLERLKSVYNLTDAGFAEIRGIYHKGNEGSAAEHGMTPKDPSVINQAVFAAILITHFNLSHTEFIKAKENATARNVGRANLDTEMWPPRPDLFKNAQEGSPNGVSDDELLGYFLNERNPLSSSEEDEIEGGGMSLSTSRSCRRFSAHQSPYASCNGKVELLHRMWQTFGDWGTLSMTMKLYSISRSKAAEIRTALTSLKESNIRDEQGNVITWEDFEDTFDKPFLMDMALQKDKTASIKQVVLINKRTD